MTKVYKSCKIMYIMCFKLIELANNKHISRAKFKGNSSQGENFELR